MSSGSEGFAESHTASAFVRARALLGSGAKVSAAEALSLAGALRESLQYGLARRVAALGRRDTAASPDVLFRLMRIEVTCTYKDTELPVDQALTAALAMLEAFLESQSVHGALSEEMNAEVWSLGGAIHKRWWEYDQQRMHLEESLTSYRRAFGRTAESEGNPYIDRGYPAINAAYVLEILASLELAAVDLDSPISSLAFARIQDATILRSAVAERINADLAFLREGGILVPGDDYWFYATAAEVFIGLGRYPEAVEALRQALAKPHSDWNLESTVGQLARLARLQESLRTSGMGSTGIVSPVESATFGVLPAFEAIRAGLGAQWSGGVETAFTGKLGLALSGGGFRAALYHIGVLARLADLDLLRRVEVLSCVSGGSIIGARYYLEVRRLLESKEDALITADDYRDIVHRLEVEFLTGVQYDIRNRLFASLRISWDAVFSRGRSRTDGLGELLEEHLLRLVDDGTRHERTTKALFLNSLYVAPRRAGSGKGARSSVTALTHMMDFNPRLQNWRRAAKVPVLILNATTLNTGHPWQFTASWMGEPSSAYDPATSATPRLLRVRYSDAPESLREIRLGAAVAASAAVPGLFDPLPLEGLYEGAPSVRLADGGVHDNQGAGGLLDQQCTVLIISDASGQLTVGGTPGDPYSVSKRANDVLMTRVRETQLQLLGRMRDVGVLRAVAHTHLRLDLSSPPEPPVGGVVPGGDGDGLDPVDFFLARRAPSAVVAGARAKGSTDSYVTAYGVRRDMAAQLSAIRTDLDAFHDLEAASLMSAGYLASEAQLHEIARGTSTGAPHATPWRFRWVEPLLTRGGRADPITTEALECLAKSQQVLGKGATDHSGVLPLLSIAFIGAVIWGLVAVPRLVAHVFGTAVLILLGVSLLLALLVWVIALSSDDPRRPKAGWIRWSGLIPIWPVALCLATRRRASYLRLGNRERWERRAAELNS